MFGRVSQVRPVVVVILACIPILFGCGAPSSSSGNCGDDEGSIVGRVVFGG